MDELVFFLFFTDEVHRGSVPSDEHSSGTPVDTFLMDVPIVGLYVIGKLTKEQASARIEARKWFKLILRILIW